VKRKPKRGPAITLALGILAACSTPPPPEPSPPPPGLFLVGDLAARRDPVSFAEVEEKSRNGSAVTISETDIKNITPAPATGALGGALLGAVAGGERGALIGAAAGAALGGGAGYLVARNNEKPAATPNPDRVAEFYNELKAGRLNVSFLRAFEPPLSVRVQLFSNPASAVLYIRGAPTRFSTFSDLYLSPDDMQASTLQLAGYAPCQVPLAIVPGLQLPSGEEAVTVRCSLQALAVAPPPKTAVKRGR
jgi:hypothetical protein